MQRLFASAGALAESVLCWWCRLLNGVKLELALPVGIFSRSGYLLTSPLELCYDFVPHLGRHFVTGDGWLVAISRGEGGRWVVAPSHPTTRMITQCEYITSAYLSLLPRWQQRPDFKWVYMAVIDSLGICRIKPSYVLGTEYLAASTVEILRPEDVISPELISLADNLHNFFI